MFLNERIKLPNLNENLIRPCYSYGEEFDECVTLKGRFHQYFIYGNFRNCSQWRKDYENCLLCKHFKNKTACEKLLISERKRRNERLKGHYENDIWQKRDKPPDNWNMSLPIWIKENNTNSYFHKHNDN